MDRLIALEAENIKKLKAVRIDFAGNPVTVIGGKNGAGKSSTLDCIEYALGGKPDVEQPVRNGQKKGYTLVETEKLVIKRTFTEGGSKLEVTGKNGDQRYAIKTPQAVLDQLIGDKLAFDPFAFSRMEPKAQVETLKALVGLDFSKLDAERQQVYDERTAVNREVKNLEAQISATTLHPGTPDAEESVSALVAELERRQGVNAENNKQRDKYKELEENYTSALAEYDRLTVELAKAKRKVDEIIEEVNNLKPVIRELKDEPTDEIKNRMDEAERTNAKVRENQKRQELVKQANEKDIKAKQLTDRLEKIDEEKAKALLGAKFPVPGLAFNDSGVTYNGIPFAQSSSGEKLRVSVAMGLAMHRGLKLLLIRDGSLLDPDNLRMIDDMAREAKAHVLIERVGEGEECSVIIEDGSVKEVRKEAAI